MARLCGTKIRNFTFYPDIRVFPLQGCSYGANKIADGPDLAHWLKGKSQLSCFVLLEASRGHDRSVALARGHNVLNEHAVAV